MADLQTWAYRAAGGGKMMGAYRQQEHEATMKTIDELVKIGEKIGKGKGDYSKQAQKVIDQNGALPPSEYKALQDQLMNKDQPEYINGNNQQKTKKLLDTAKMGEQYNDFSNYKIKFAEDDKAGNFSNKFKESDLYKFLAENILSNKQILKQFKCPEGEECEDGNNMGIYLPDYDVINTAKDEIWKNNQRRTLSRSIDSKSFTISGRVGETHGSANLQDYYTNEMVRHQNAINANPEKWTALSSLNSEYDSYLIDRKAQGAISTAGATFKKVAYDRVPEDDIGFNIANAKQIVQDTIVGPHDINSLIYDPMIGKRVLYQDLQDHIMGKEREGGRTYADFIPQDMLMKWDIDGDGEIEGNEAKTVADALLADKNKDKFGMTLKDKYVEDYYVNFLKLQDDLGANTSRKKKNEGNNNNNNSDQKPDEPNALGGRVVDGIWRADDDVVVNRENRKDIIPRSRS